MRRTLLAVALAALAAVAVYAALAWRAERRAAPPAEAAVPQPATADASAPETPPSETGERLAEGLRGGEPAVAAGETLEVDATKLVPGEPLAVRLVLGEPSRTAEPLVGHIYAADGRVLELEGVLGDDRLDARVEIDSSFLTPGRYLVDVKTTEATHFPIRRYVLDVK
jgi:hypothetical protein